MVDPNTRQGKRTPVTLKIKFKSETLEQFIERYAVDVSQGGIFIRTKEPLAVGTQMRFEFQLRDASPLIAGEGTVVWTRENDPSRPAIAPGMGVRFDRLAEGSQTVLERILSEKAKQAPSRGGEVTKPPMFTDTPTKVAPAPIQEALLGEPKSRPSGNLDGGTPLPKPMPFHSDAEDFDEQAFEEATKVRAVDELVAQSALADAEAGAKSSAPSKPTTVPPETRAAKAPEPAASPFDEPPASADEPVPGVPDRDSAPILPGPPEVEPPRALDTPRPSSPSPAAVLPSLAATGSDDASPARTKLGVEPARASVNRPANRATPTPVDEASSGPYPAKKSSAMPMVILVLFILAAAGAAVWFFVLREKAKPAEVAGTGSGSGNVATKPNDGSGSAGATTGSGSDAVAGSGSQMTAVGSGSGSGTIVEAPKGPTVDTVITSNIESATVEVVGTDQKGPAPFTAKLEKDKEYQVKVAAPGFATATLDLKGGAAKQTAKLEPKAKKIEVTSAPDVAAIWIDNKMTGKFTPATIDVPKDKLAAKTFRVSIRKAGFKPVEKTLKVAEFTETDDAMTAKVEATLEKAAAIVRPPPNTGSGSGAGSAAGSGSAPPPNGGSGDGGGGGSAAPPPPPPPPPAAPAEPEPKL